jgi:hypothetical protein
VFKLYELVPRRSDISAQEFHDHWRHPHGTLCIPIPTLWRYVQNHRLDTSLLDGDQGKYDGIVEAWFETVEHVQGLSEDAQFVQHVKPDEPAFIDVDDLVLFFAQEEVLASPAENARMTAADTLWDGPRRSVCVKVLQLVALGGNAAWAGDNDAELGAEVGALRHVRAYPASEIHGDDPPYLGVRELWWPTLVAFERGVTGAPDAWAELLGQAGASYTMFAQSELVK